MILQYTHWRINVTCINLMRGLRFKADTVFHLYYLSLILLSQNICKHWKTLWTTDAHYETVLKQYLVVSCEPGSVETKLLQFYTEIVRKMIGEKYRELKKFLVVLFLSDIICGSWMQSNNGCCNVDWKEMSNWQSDYAATITIAYNSALQRQIDQSQKCNMKFDAFMRLQATNAEFNSVADGLRWLLQSLTLTMKMIKLHRQTTSHASKWANWCIFVWRCWWLSLV